MGMAEVDNTAPKYRAWSIVFSLYGRRRRRCNTVAAHTFAIRTAIRSHTYFTNRRRTTGMPQDTYIVCTLTDSFKMFELYAPHSHLCCFVACSTGPHDSASIRSMSVCDDDVIPFCGYTRSVRGKRCIVREG